MPLSFISRNHGNIAFGFFNIESDMLLLENYFFFADDFTHWINQMADLDDPATTNLQVRVYHIDNLNDIGDLMGAIHGIRLTGFIGRVYEYFPFPDDPQAFKQNPDGYQTRDIVTSQIKEFARKKDIRIKCFKKDRCVEIGRYLFDLNVFHELIRYVWQGGYPRWKEEKRPACVIEMKHRVLSSDNPFFKECFHPV